MLLTPFQSAKIGHKNKEHELAKYFQLQNCYKTVFVSSIQWHNSIPEKYTLITEKTPHKRQLRKFTKQFDSRKMSEARKIHLKFDTSSMTEELSIEHSEWLIFFFLSIWSWFTQHLHTQLVVLFFRCFFSSYKPLSNRKEWPNLNANIFYHRNTE